MLKSALKVLLKLKRKTSTQLSFHIPKLMFYTCQQVDYKGKSQLPFCEYTNDFMS